MDEETLITVLLAIHITSGIIALITGLLAIIFKKGRGKHSKAGNVFYYAMYGIGGSGIALSIIHPNPFLLVVGIASIYLSFSGKQCIKFWQLKASYTPKFKDKIVAYLALLTALYMLGVGISLLFDGRFHILYLVFGTMLCIGTIAELNMFRKKVNFEPRTKKWLIKHIAMMGGAYIATVTAFLVVNVHFSPSWVVWLSPSLIGTIMIIFASNKWEKKLKMK